MNGKKITLKKTPTRKQNPLDRAHNFFEVALGYNLEEAKEEAKRCIECKKPTCIKGCPVEIDIPAFIKKIKEEKFLEAAEILKKENPLPAVCGRVCPQEDQCEKVCILARKGEPVAIGRLERFVADYEAKEKCQNQSLSKSSPEKTGKKVAVVGSGPASLVCASELAKKGYSVTIFESLHEPGGVLVYGIPEFRLPKEIVKREVEYIKSLGVDIVKNFFVGKTRTVDELMNEDGYEAVFVGTGAGLPTFMYIPGENLLGVYSANEFLTRMNLMKAFKFPEYDTPVKVGERVGVIGGGNVAMDSARVALRAGAKKVTVFYRRTRNEMPARIEEIENAEEEGIEFLFLVAPVEYMGDEAGWVRKAKLIRMRLGEPDASGRRRPVPMEDSEFILPVETVVVAIGQNPSPMIAKTTPDLEIHPRWGTLVVNEKTGATTKQGVFAGGDVTTGAATVILAAGAGKNAAKYVDYYLQNKEKQGIWEKLI
ncbi:NADPH-dependent glutamate synthase [Candidatus Aerophobetes bacterium]|nr:NADPH-dependent glutamate synthase [Candidatus Aerophobetes bacterium]